MRERRRASRVVDESGEDYYNPAGFFLHHELPEKIDRALRRARPVDVGKRKK